MEHIEGTSPLKEGERYTLEQWKTWPEGERWELIGGVAYNMSPAPRVSHQNVVSLLIAQLINHLEGSSCKALVAPCDVFLPDGVEDSEETVVQPDILVVCNPDIIQEDGIHGAPNFIVEVLSNSTAYRDIGEKKDLYERAGVAEYWILNPGSGAVFQYLLKDGRYDAVIEFRRGEEVKSAALPGFVWRA